MKMYTIIVSCMFILISFSQTASAEIVREKTPGIKSAQILISKHSGPPIIREVILQRVYVDGDISEESLTETIWSMEDFWAQYTGWQLISQNNKQVIFQKHLNDISPLLKTNGYFGLSDDGTLSIFNGRPSESHIIQSFFQLDIKKLEGRTQKKLYDGIKISDKKQYDDVLETFKSYTK
ncbi:forespore regulator of the sigma-K checkpoint [Peribacillus deserti]|uniref:Forespore regulator of the sigma-K checkpoint n=1 Tax=Peribacillus deserti TaxID=673318 RepID=A0ABS2QHA5_9BACI|nr:intercompartmental signaling factor BofC [Peribacillus deserti]MBM7691898.1 forespore regulator of the sigma-K checkpoint [Peribacillus deserti]